jgi:hypothetical protein
MHHGEILIFCWATSQGQVQANLLLEYYTAMCTHGVHFFHDGI